MNLNPEIADQSNEEQSRELSEGEESQSGLPAESEGRKPAPTEPENDNNNVGIRCFYFPGQCETGSIW